MQTLFVDTRHEHSKDVQRQQLIEHYVSTSFGCVSFDVTNYTYLLLLYMNGNNDANTW